MAGSTHACIPAPPTLQTSDASGWKVARQLARPPLASDRARRNHEVVVVGNLIGGRRPGRIAAPEKCGEVQGVDSITGIGRSVDESALVEYLLPIEPGLKDAVALAGHVHPDAMHDLVPDPRCEPHRHVPDGVAEIVAAITLLLREVHVLDRSTTGAPHATR